MIMKSYQNIVDDSRDSRFYANFLHDFDRLTNNF